MLLKGDYIWRSEIMMWNWVLVRIQQQWSAQKHRSALGESKRTFVCLSFSETGTANTQIWKSTQAHFLSLHGPDFSNVANNTQNSMPQRNERTVNTGWEKERERGGRQRERERHTHTHTHTQSNTDSQRQTHARTHARTTHTQKETDRQTDRGRETETDRQTET